jgi:hypothetical protein
MKTSQVEQEAGADQDDVVAIGSEFERLVPKWLEVGLTKLSQSIYDGEVFAEFVPFARPGLDFGLPG